MFFIEKSARLLHGTPISIEISDIEKQSGPSTSVTTSSSSSPHVNGNSHAGSLSASTSSSVARESAVSFKKGDQEFSTPALLEESDHERSCSPLPDNYKVRKLHRRHTSPNK